LQNININEIQKELSQRPSVGQGDRIGDLVQIVLEILSQYCSRLFQEPATVLR
jgi:hypothetical protein